MITLSKTAQTEIKRLQSQPQNQNTKLKISVEPGGCAGLFYHLEFSPPDHNTDNIYDCQGIEIAIASHSINYLYGIVIDYTEDLMGGGFRFNNPQAEKTCSCGNSFQIV
ncbi:MAG TPA: iron-sulfur cluster assembly accessory protein [Allocoleopsis sp.]